MGRAQGGVDPRRRESSSWCTTTTTSRGARSTTARTLIVIRKGRDAGVPGQEGFIGGSMGDDAVIVQGSVGSLGTGARARRSARRAVFDRSRRRPRDVAHAGGRQSAIGKTGAVISAGRVTPRDDERLGAARRASFCECGGLDESPHVYRRLPDVLAAQEGTVEVLHTLRATRRRHGGRERVRSIQGLNPTQRSCRTKTGLTLEQAIVRQCQDVPAHTSSMRSFAFVVMFAAASLSAQQPAQAGATLTAADFGHRVPVPSRRGGAASESDRASMASSTSRRGARQHPSPSSSRSTRRGGSHASQRTEVRILDDDNALYIGAKMFDDHGAAGVTTRLVRRDASFDSDYLGHRDRRTP